MSLSAIAGQLAYFHPEAVKLNGPALPNDINLAEQRLSIAFPSSLRSFLAWHNGGWIADLRLFGVAPIDNRLDIVSDSEMRRSTFGSLWPRTYLAVSTDSAGCPYAIAAVRENERAESPVVHVDCISMEATAVVASNYLAFVWFAVSDRIRVLTPAGQYRSDDELDQLSPDWLTRWYHRKDFLLARDPDVTYWRSILNLEAREP